MKFEMGAAVTIILGQGLSLAWYHYLWQLELATREAEQEGERDGEIGWQAVIPQSYTSIPGKEPNKCCFRERVDAYSLQHKCVIISFYYSFLTCPLNIKNIIFITYDFNNICMYIYCCVWFSSICPSRYLQNSYPYFCSVGVVPVPLIYIH